MGYTRVLTGDLIDKSHLNLLHILKDTFENKQKTKKYLR